MTADMPGGARTGRAGAAPEEAEEKEKCRDGGHRECRGGPMIPKTIIKKRHVPAGTDGLLPGSSAEGRANAHRTKKAKRRLLLQPGFWQKLSYCVASGEDLLQTIAEIQERYFPRKYNLNR